MERDDKADIAHIVRRYGEAEGAAKHCITWGLNAAFNALHKGVSPTRAVLFGMDELDAAVETLGEINA